MFRATVSFILVIPVLSACSTERQYNSPIVSGGLGISRADWENSYEGTKWEDSAQVLFRVGTREYLVLFRDGNADIIHFKDKGTAMTLESARRETEALIPRDSKLLGSQPDSQSIFDDYYSESLRARFSETSWRSGKPGHFHVVYLVKNGAIESLVIQVG